MTLRLSVIALTALVSTAIVSEAAVATATLTDKSARRYPQPVRVGDLIGRQVLEPVPAQHVLGRVASVDQNARGGVDIVVRFGGFLGFGTRLIAVPVEAVALLGEHLAVLDFTPEQLREFPTADEAAERALAPDRSIRVGLTKPFH